MKVSEIKFLWNAVGVNNGEPIYSLQFGDYSAKVVKGFPCDTLGRDKGLWSYKVNGIGRLFFETAADAQNEAEAVIRRELTYRLNKARETVELYGHIITDLG